MTVKQIYEKFGTPKNLQEHMLRVSALAKIITDNWKGEKFDKEAVIAATALHDIGKPVSFKLDTENLTRYGIPLSEGVKLKRLKEFIKNNYSPDEHGASVEIARDMGMGEMGLKILNNVKWEYIPKLISENDIETYISVYCDMRIGPNGILKILERVRNLRKRYSPDKYNYDDLEKDAIILEKKIQENVALDLNLISDDSINYFFRELLNIEI